MISIYLDTNVLDFFVDHAIDPVAEFEEDAVIFLVPAKIEHELNMIPEAKSDVRNLVATLRANGHLATDLRFGFVDLYDPESGRFSGGFADLNEPGSGGRMSDEKETSFESRHSDRLGSIRKKTGLQKNEADLALAAMATHSLVLTCDLKPGPLRDAFVETGRVIDIRKYLVSTKSFRDFVLDPARAV